MSQKREHKASQKHERFVRSDTGEEEVPPVIIKGGSLDVEFGRVPFHDPVNNKDIVLVQSPPASSAGFGKITLVEFRNKVTKQVFAFMPLPTGLTHENCLICIWDDQ